MAFTNQVRLALDERKRVVLVDAKPVKKVRGQVVGREEEAELGVDPVGGSVTRAAVGGFGLIAVGDLVDLELELLLVYLAGWNVGEVLGEFPDHSTRVEVKWNP